MAVQQLVGILLVFVVILAEDHGDKIVVLVDDGQLIDLVIPDDIIRFFKGCPFIGENQLLERSHERPDLGVRRRPAEAIISACKDTHQSAVRSSVIGDGDGGVSGPVLDCQGIR